MSVLLSKNNNEINASNTRQSLTLKRIVKSAFSCQALKRYPQIMAYTLNVKHA